MIEWIELHDKFLMVALTAGMFGVGLATTLITAYLFRENMLLRKAGTEPEVVAYVIPDRAHPSILKLYLKNVGSGPAIDVEYSTNIPPNEFASKRVRIPQKQGAPLAILPQESEFSVFFGQGPELFRAPELAPFCITLRYKNLGGQAFSRTSTVDFAQFNGFTWIGRDPQDSIAESLKKIEQHLNKFGWTTKFKVVSATPDQWREYEERQYDEMQNERSAQG